MPTKLLCSAVALVAQTGLLSLAAALPRALYPNSTANTQPSTNLCGNNQHIILEGTPWLVANSMYGADRMVGTSCTYFDHIETSAGGNSQVVWSSTTNIQDVDGTDNYCKGYTNVGLIQNLENSISSISSIPATYDLSALPFLESPSAVVNVTNAMNRQWTRKNSSPFKGNICFDFILSNTKGDSTSGSAQELMLWLEWEGGQLPIGWDNNQPFATIPSLFDTSWNIYKGENAGMAVYSMLPNTQFSGSFSGDLKQWFEALVRLGIFTEATYVNIGNAGSEIFWGQSVLHASLGVQINLS